MPVGQVKAQLKEVKILSQHQKDDLIQRLDLLRDVHIEVKNILAEKKEEDAGNAKDKQESLPREAFGDQREELDAMRTVLRGLGIETSLQEAMAGVLDKPAEQRTFFDWFVVEQLDQAVEVQRNRFEAALEADRSLQEERVARAVLQAKETALKVKEALRPQVGSGSRIQRSGTSDHAES